MKEKKEKILIKIEDFEMHHCQHFGG